MRPHAALLYASTNKVYGGMDEVEIVEREGRYAYADYPFGIPETYPLDFHSPYGCSKGAGDQYVRDYARIYGLKTLVLRQSCIYGQRQFGVEDQGWVAHFVIAAVKDRPITIFGDGKQVRDVLFIDDLVRAYALGIDANGYVARRGAQPGRRAGQHPVDLGRVRAVAGRADRAAGGGDLRPVAAGRSARLRGRHSQGGGAAGLAAGGDPGRGYRPSV